MYHIVYGVCHMRHDARTSMKTKNRAQQQYWYYAATAVLLCTAPYA